MTKSSLLCLADAEKCLFMDREIFEVFISWRPSANAMLHFKTGGMCFG